MIKSQQQATVVPSFRETPGHFLIQITLDEQDRADAWELCWEILRLGGVETRLGFAFPTDARREMALEILGERYAWQYFKKVDIGLGVSSQKFAEVDSTLEASWSR